MNSISLTLTEDVAKQLMVLLVEKMMQDRASRHVAYPVYHKLRGVVGGRHLLDIASTASRQVWNQLSPHEKEIVVFCEG